MKVVCGPLDRQRGGLDCRSGCPRLQADPRDCSWVTIKVGFPTYAG